MSSMGFRWGRTGRNKEKGVTGWVYAKLDFIHDCRARLPFRMRAGKSGVLDQLLAHFAASGVGVIGATGLRQACGEINDFQGVGRGVIKTLAC
jgi:hypothetical protein